MNKWVVRMVGILLLLVFLMVFAQLHRQLEMLQRQQQESSQSQ